jgi:hypothetical protein
MRRPVQDECGGGKPHSTRIGNLIRLLSSPHDGEAMGAVRALDRVLAHAGGFHHLADVIETHWRPPIVIKPTFQPEPDPDWQILAARLLQYPQILLGSRERDFLENMKRSVIPPSDKQWKWLSDIEGRLPPNHRRNCDERT